MTILDKEIADYLPLLNEEEKRSLISVIRSFINSKNTETSISIDQYKKELAEGEAEFVNGEYITHTQMKNMVNQWSRNNAK